MMNILKNSLAKQFLVFVFCIMLSLLIAFLITNNYVRNNVIKNTLDLHEKNMMQIEGKIEDYYDTMNHIAMSLAYSPTTEMYFRQTELDRIISMEDLAMVFSNTMLLEEDIIGIYLYDMEKSQIAANGKKVEEKFLVWESEETMSFSDLFHSQDSYEYNYIVTCPVFDLNSQQYGRQVGTSIFLMKVDGLRSFLADSQITENTEIYLIDSNDRIIVSSGNTDFEELDSDMKVSSDSYLVQYSNTVVDNWKIISRIPRDELYRNTNGGRGTLALTYSIACILIVLLTLFCYRNFFVRISQVDKFIRKVTLNPKDRMQEKRMDEIGCVVHSLNQMLDDKEKLSNEIQESQKRMYEIELAGKQLQVLAYRNQINPHFLYNTFECIRGMALYHDMDDIAEITMALSKVFRFAVKPDNIVSLREEVEYIKEYATIIDYRFTGKIEVDIDADESLLEKKVIKLILQPLVENSVFHGLEQKIGDGEVNVIIRRKWDNYIMFLVEDNGCGMDEQMLHQVRNSLEEKENKKEIGLSNIYRRLKLFYGDDVVFEIKSKEGKGTRVMIVLPDHVKEG